jgi:hypothetical protein
LLEVESVLRAARSRLPFLNWGWGCGGIRVQIGTLSLDRLVSWQVGLLAPDRLWRALVVDLNHRVTVRDNMPGVLAVAVILSWNVLVGLRQDGLGRGLIVNLRRGFVSSDNIWRVLVAA